MHQPSVEETVQILKGLKTHYEEHHGVTYTGKALAAAAELSAKHINDRQLPDKAIDVLDEAGAADRLRPDAKRHSKITARDVERVVAKIAKIPERTVSTDDKAALQSSSPSCSRSSSARTAAIERHRERDQAVALRPRRAGEADRLASSSPARPASARPSSPSSSPASSASSSCAST